MSWGVLDTACLPPARLVWGNPGCWGLGLGAALPSWGCHLWISGPTVCRPLCRPSPWSGAWLSSRLSALGSCVADGAMLPPQVQQLCRTNLSGSTRTSRSSTVCLHCQTRQVLKKKKKLYFYCYDKLECLPVAPILINFRIKCSN